MISEQRYILALSFIKGIGDNRLKFLIDQLGSAENVWNQKKEDLQKIPYITPNIAKEIGNNKYLRLADNEIEFCNRYLIDIRTYYNENYPTLLKECPDSPVVLYSKGNINFEFGKKIAIVGTRKMTNYGKQFIEHLVEEIKPYNITIVSGLAYGCDIHAHHQAIKNNIGTWAVLAHHLNHIYPSAHRQIAEQMLENGGWISEQPSFKEVSPKFFLQRNRIIAGLSDLTILVESGMQGGSLVTAKFANEYNREVLALAGRNSDAYSKGCNYLIKTHQAYLIDDPKDLLYHLDVKKSTHESQLQIFSELTENEIEIVNFLRKNGKMHIDTISVGLNQMSYQLMPILLDLELKQIIKPLPGKFFDLQSNS